MIEVIPSIAIIEGKCVRLEQGDYTRQKVYDISPVDLAKQFEDNGIKKIHMIDLEGTKQGMAVNMTFTFFFAVKAAALSKEIMRLPNRYLPCLFESSSIKPIKSKCLPKE